MRLTKVGTPVTSSDGNDGQLGDDDSGTDSSSDFLGGLDTQTDVTLGVTNNDDGLESSTLTGTSLLLDGLDLLVEIRLATVPLFLRKTIARLPLSGLESGISRSTRVVRSVDATPQPSTSIPLFS